MIINSSKLLVAYKMCFRAIRAQIKRIEKLLEKINYFHGIFHGGVPPLPLSMENNKLFPHSFFKYSERDSRHFERYQNCK